MKVSELKPGPLKIILLSPSGRGKTALMATLGESLQILDTDGGMETAVRLEDKWQKDRLSCDIFQIPEPKPTMEAVQYQKLKDSLITISNLCAAGKYPFKAIGLDSFTSSADACLRYILQANGRLQRSPTVPSKTNPGGGITQPEWGLFISELEQIILLLRGLPVHVIMLCHTQPENVNGLIRQEIAIPTQKLPPKIPNYFDEIWYLDHQVLGANETKRVLRTVESPTYIAKSRAQLPDGTDVDLGLKEIFKRLGREV